MHYGDDFLQPEFGFKEQFLQVTFSGHRGFHLHYRDPSLFHLDSEARRELVSHIRGGVDVQGGLTRINDDRSNGWAKRIRKQIPNLIDKLVRIAERQEDSPRLMKDLHLALKDHLQREGKPGKGPASIQKLADMFLHDERKQSVVNGQISRLGAHQALLDWLNPMHRLYSVPLGKQTRSSQSMFVDKFVGRPHFMVKQGCE